MPHGSYGPANTLHRNCMHDTKVHKCAIKLEDTDLLAKLAPGNMHAEGKVLFQVPGQPLQQS